MIDLVLVALPNLYLTNPKMYFPLGILYLASSVQNSGYSVQIVDMRDGEKELPKANYYGFSCTTPEINDGKRIANKARELGGITIAGGCHPSLMPDDCVDDFDFIIRGEGEYALPQLMKGEVTGKVITAERIKVLSKLSLPAWDLVEKPFSEELFPGERYGRGHKAMTVINSRGCPFKCSFCGNLFQTPLVYRSVDNIILELDALKKRGVHYVRFEDDNFNVHPDFENLCLKIHKIGIKWKCHTRSKLVNLGQMDMMKWAGCEEVGLGIESSDDVVLEINNKEETSIDHKKAVLIIREAGLRVKTYFIAGLPGETDKTLEQNKLFFQQVKPDKWTVSTFTPYPGCEVYKNPKGFGIEIIEKDYSKWWNFTQDRMVHKLCYEEQSVTWNRYKEFYNWLVDEEWKR